MLATHRGLDLGAFELARFLARRLAAPLHASTVTRLLVDLNRSPHNPRGMFSELVADLPDEKRQAILRVHYHPYRRAVEAALRRAGTLARPARHLSVHSFTPVWRGERRRVDVGLLFDPSRPLERGFAHDWQDRLQHALPELRIRRNNPYRGTADGFTVHLRRSLGARYVGIEIEVNQAIAAGPAGPRRALHRAVAETFGAAVAAAKG